MILPLRGAPALRRTKDRPLDPRALLAADPGAGKLIATVPFLPQTMANCGPTSVAMVLRYWGVAADPDQIAKKFESSTAGTFTVDLLIAANDAGMDARWIKGDLDRLRAEIKADRPVIVFMNQAFNPLPFRHFAVAIGYLKYQSKNFIVLHSGPSAFLMVPEKDFLREWNRTQRMMLTIAPKTPAPKSGSNQP
jgi:ABC-type bacteriocin/lantibiotic exporter with double-glycine peptidase domain